MITEKQIDARMEVIMQSRSHNILFHDGTAETYDAAFIVRATSMLTDEQFEDCIHYLMISMNYYSLKAKVRR